MSVLFMNTSQRSESSSLKEKRSIRSRNISYEDLLVGKYLEEIQQNSEKKPSSIIGHRKLEIESPYLQKLSHSNFLNAIYSTNSRFNTNVTTSNLNSVRTAKTNSRANSALAQRPASSQLINHKFEAYNRNNETSSGIFVNTNNILQLQNLSLRRERPSSAPVKRSKTSSRRKINKQPLLIKALAYRNGCRDGSFMIAARNINEFLNIATERLQLSRAARRIFLENGDEIRHESQFLNNSSVFISCGEEFEDPFLMTKNMIEKRKSTVWTSNGVHFLSNKDEHDNKDSLKNSKNDRQTRTIRFTKRIVCYENGKEYDPCLVVIELKNPNSTKQDITNDSDQAFFKDFLEECSTRMKISAKSAYNWFGDKIQTINDIPKLDKCLQSLVNKVELAPCWISKGEGFDARGALIFVENLIKFTKENRKEINHKKSKLKTVLEELQNIEPSNKTRVTHLQILEANESLKKIQYDLKELNNSIAYIETIANNLKSIHETQMNEGSGALYKHIKEVTSNDRIVGGPSNKSLKLKIYINGTENSFEVLINHRDVRIFDNILREICSAYSRNEKSTYPHKFTRIFNETGTEIKQTEFKLFNNQTIWVSTGENWIDPKKETVYAVSLKVRTLFAINNQSSQEEPKLDETNNDSHNMGSDKDEDNAEEDDDSLLRDDDSSDQDSQSSENKLKSFLKQKTFFKNKNKKIKTTQSMEIVSRSVEFNFKTYTESLKLERIDKFIKTDDWDVLTDSELIQKYLNENQVSNEYLNSAENPIEINYQRTMQLALQCRHNKNILLVPQLSINGKTKDKDNNSLWYSDFQLWRFTQTGLIFNQFFSKLCLTLDMNTSFKFEIYLKKPADPKNEYQPIEPITLNGYTVVLSSRKTNNDSNEHQQWHYNKFGNIYSKTLNNKRLVLTDLNLLKNDLSNLTKNNILDKYDIKFNEENTIYNLDDLSLILIDSFEEQLFQHESDKLKNKLSKDLSKSQHWAIKQDGFIAKSNREWKLSKLATFKWNKLAYTWPVDENEQLITNFSWPMTGFLISGAPILKTLEDPIDDSTRSRLRVMKNGSIDISTAVVLSRMEVKNLIKEHKENLIKESKNLVHCTGLTYSKLEFNAFLDACTNSLNLNSAARRLFDEHGEEHFDLNKLDQDQIVYISQGEVWIHPKSVKEEQDRKTLLNNLADDLNKISYFNRLKLCSNFVIETSKMSFQEGTKLVVGPCCLSQNQLERIKQGESIQHVIEIEEKLDESVEENKNMKAHERSHEHVDSEYAKKFRWPWEQIANRSLETLFGRKSQEFQNENELEESELRESTDQQSMREKFKPRGKKTTKNAKLSSQKFAYGNGFIYCVDYPNLVLGVADIENNQIEVILMKKNEESPYQKWVHRPNNLIVLKTRPNLALSIKIPPLDCVDVLDLNSTESNILINNPNLNKPIIHEASIILQSTIESDYGNAHQKWFLDESIGLLYAFVPPNSINIESQIDLSLNIDVTSANRSMICTSYVAYDKEISQPGYICEIVEHQQDQSYQKISKVLICSSCANFVRGKYKLARLTKSQSFTCHFGKVKDKFFKQSNGFKYLCGKVDLSSDEAENSFVKWFNKLLSLKKLSNPKSVLNELSGVKSLYTIKLLVYKNGEGRLKPGELIIGSTIQSMLDQAMNRLQLRNAARRFYTQDGTLILDVQDLIDWCLNFYKKENQKSELEDTKHKFENSLKQASVSFYSNSATSVIPARRASIGDLKKNEPKEPEKILNDIKPKIQPSLLDKVEFSEIAQGPNKNTTIPSNAIIREDSFSNENKNNQSEISSNKPSKNELKRFINELDRAFHIDTKKLLKWPVEVWVSCGEAFISPEIVKHNENKKQQKREQINTVQTELEKQTHTLRQMTGRRMNKQTIGEYKAVKNPECPVVKEGHWSEVPFEEQVKQAEVYQLRNYVDEIKNPNKNSERAKSSNTQLYGSHPITKRVLVYLNGQVPDKALFCWATSMDDLNEAVKIKFRLNKPIKFFFTEDGKIISRFEDISRDQLVCVSSGREFISADQRNKDVEIKASWSRKIKEEGINATDIKVNSKLNVDINVDPFAAPQANKTKPNLKHLALTAPSNSNKSSKFTNNNNINNNHNDKRNYKSFTVDENF